MLNHPVTGLTNASEWRGQELRAEAERYRLVALIPADPAGDAPLGQMRGQDSWTQLRAIFATWRARRAIALGGRCLESHAE